MTAPAPECPNCGGLWEDHRDTPILGGTTKSCNPAPAPLCPGMHPHGPDGNEYHCAGCREARALKERLKDTEDAMETMRPIEWGLKEAEETIREETARADAAEAALVHILHHILHHCDQVKVRKDARCGSIVEARAALEGDGQGGVVGGLSAPVAGSAVGPVTPPPQSPPARCPGCGTNHGTPSEDEACGLPYRKARKKKGGGA